MESADEISWDLMRSDEIKKMRYSIRHDEISDEIGRDLMGLDEISVAKLRSRINQTQGRMKE